VGSVFFIVQGRGVMVGALRLAGLSQLIVLNVIGSLEDCESALLGVALWVVQRRDLELY